MAPKHPLKCNQGGRHELAKCTNGYAAPKARLLVAPGGGRFDPLVERRAGFGLKRRPPPRRASVVGVRKTALCRDACGGLRRIDFLLPGDLVAQLSRPLDIEFVDGDQPLTADEISKAVQANFLKAFAGSA